MYRYNQSESPVEKRLCWTFSVKYGLQMKKRKENIGICGNFIKSACGIISFFELYLRHICFI